MPPEPPDRPLRSDAARNRARVVQAALEVFAEQGLAATIPEVAARAGVGKATIYRSFPTREHLVATIVCERLGWYRDRAAAAAEAPDPWQGFVALMFDAADRQADDRALAAALAAANERPEVAATRAEAIAAIGAVMRRAQAQGAMRPDVTPADVQVLFGGVGRILNETVPPDRAAWHRATALLVDAFRADGTPARRL